MSNFVKRVRDIMRNDAGINGDAQRIEQIAWMLFLKVYDAKEQDWEWDEEDYQSIIPEKCRWRNWGHDEDGKGMTGDILLDFINNTLFPTLKNLPVNADNLRDDWPQKRTRERHCHHSILLNLQIRFLL